MTRQDITISNAYRIMYLLTTPGFINTCFIYKSSIHIILEIFNYFKMNQYSYKLLYFLIHRKKVTSYQLGSSDNIKFIGLLCP